MKGNSTTGGTGNRWLKGRRAAAGLVASVLLGALALAPVNAQGPVDCRLTFDLAGWSVFYKTTSGTGTVTCDNGQRMAVKIETRGGGLSVGKSKIENGVGEFSGVSDIQEVLGTYAAAEAHAGAAKSGSAQVVTKGDISLALAGTGEGWDVGVSFGAFTISR